MTTPDTTPDNENYMDDESDECSITVDDDPNVNAIPDEEEEDD